MANLSISLEGIELAARNLKYKENSPKFKVFSAIKDYYIDESSIKELTQIETDELIKKIWDVDGSLQKIKSKRRNFSSIKSSIITDLKKLAEVLAMVY